MMPVCLSDVMVMNSLTSGVFVIGVVVLHCLLSKGSLALTL